MPKLSEHGFNKYSQFGEDGIIAKIFEIIGISSKICVEFGAWDGFHFANTANLWTSDWRAVLIEADSKRYQRLIKNTAGYDCRCIQALVTSAGSNTIESILQREGITDPIDLMSIDIDGDDYYIFDSLQTMRPRVLICEYNPTIPAELELIPEAHNYFGCSAAALVKLANDKGYQLVGMTESNCIFVLDADFPKFAGYDTDIGNLKFTEHLCYLFSGYDGHYIASREPTYGVGRPSNLKFKGEYFSFPSPNVGSLIRNMLKQK